MTSPPETLGSVRLLERIGAGGMGEVWRGERTSAGGVRRRVALKRILAQYAKDPVLRERFLAEARITARLEHPNIVQLIDFGDEPELYLVLEYIEGTSLDAMMQAAARGEGTLTLPAALMVVAEAAEALDYAHRRADEQGRPLGIVHRDVSPHNLLVSVDGAVKVSDFGIARAADNVYRTQAGLTVGKLAYMAPEQAFGRPLDKRADVFALGVVLWEAITLRALLPRSPPEATIEALRRGAFPPPSSVARGVPPQLDAVVLEALSVDPERRTPSAAHLARALRTVLHGIAPGYSSADLARVVAQLARPGRASQPARVEPTHAAAAALAAPRGAPEVPPTPVAQPRAAGGGGGGSVLAGVPTAAGVPPAPAAPPPGMAPVGGAVAPGARRSREPSFPPTEVGSFPPPATLKAAASASSPPGASASWHGAGAAQQAAQAAARAAQPPQPQPHPRPAHVPFARGAPAPAASGARTVFAILVVVLLVLLVAAGAVAAYLWYAGVLVEASSGGATPPAALHPASADVPTVFASGSVSSAAASGAVVGQPPHLIDSVRATLSGMLAASARTCALQNGGPLAAGAEIVLTAMYQPTGFASDVRVQVRGAGEREALLGACITQAMRQVPVPPSATGSAVTGLMVAP